MTYEKIKALLWPHVAVPLFLLVAIDYVAIVALFVKVFAAAYLVAQLVVFPVGFALGAVVKLSPEGRFASAEKTRLAKFFPLLAAGRAAFDHLISEA